MPVVFFHIFVSVLCHIVSSSCHIHSFIYDCTCCVCANHECMRGRPGVVEIGLRCRSFRIQDIQRLRYGIVVIGSKSKRCYIPVCYQQYSGIFHAYCSLFANIRTGRVPSRVPIRYWSPPSRNCKLWRNVAVS